VRRNAEAEDVCLDEAGDARTSILRPGHARTQHAPSGETSFPYAELSADASDGLASVAALPSVSAPRTVGRYLLGGAIASGGMATVHLGRLLGAVGFSRTVAVKRLHAHLAKDSAFVERFIDEAHIASRIHHANVVQTLDVARVDDELLLVLEYVHGESFARLRRLAWAGKQRIPANVASAIAVGTLRGLHAVHEAKAPDGQPLACVHRDVSPQNIVVGADGVARVLDFGIAKAAVRSQETRNQGVKGKLAYMAPEQIGGDAIDRRADLFAVGVVLWEALAGERLFRADDAVRTIDAVCNRVAPALAPRGLEVGPALDAVLAKALAKAPRDRFATADQMARAVEAALPPASDREVAEWVVKVGGHVLAEASRRREEFEREDASGSEPTKIRPPRPAAPGVTTTPLAMVAPALEEHDGPAPLRDPDGEAHLASSGATRVAPLTADAAQVLAAARAQGAFRNVEASALPAHEPSTDAPPAAAAPATGGGTRSSRLTFGVAAALVALAGLLVGMRASTHEAETPPAPAVELASSDAPPAAAAPPVILGAAVPASPASLASRAPGSGGERAGHGDKRDTSDKHDRSAKPERGERRHGRLAPKRPHVPPRPVPVAVNR